MASASASCRSRVVREGQSYTVELVRSPAEGRGVPANAETKHEAPVAEVIEIGGQPRNEYRRPVEHAGDHRTEPDALRRYPLVRPCATRLLIARTDDRR